MYIIRLKVLPESELEVIKCAIYFDRCKSKPRVYLFATLALAFVSGLFLRLGLCFFFLFFKIFSFFFSSNYLGEDLIIVFLPFLLFSSARACL